MRSRRGREDPEGPVFVPATFEAEYLEEARRKVAASHRRPVRGTQERTPRSPQRARMLRTTVGAGLAVLVILLMAGFTSTGPVGVTVLLIVAISLGVGRYVLGTFPRPGGDAGAGPPGEDQRPDRQ
jgi:hypothetical protein